MAERIPPRRSSTSSTSSSSRSRRPDSGRLSNLDVFSDEFALVSLQLGDGFRPPRPQGGSHDHDPDPNHHNGILQPAHTDGPADAQTQQNHDRSAGPIRRSSTSGRSGYNERRSSFMSRFNCPRQLPAHRTRTSLQKETPISTVVRSASLASTSTMPRTQSPYQGATGPSHPYAMYPQDIGVLRTPSTATTSTVRPSERSYTGPTGPTQPYGMYLQHTVPEDNVAPAQNLYPPATIGFPGPTQDYRRQLGPEAEDADDLVGPDGYTEQLPPYTRYPDGVPPKSAGPGPASILSAERDQQDSSEERLMNTLRQQGSLQETINEPTPEPTPEPLCEPVGNNPSSTELTAVAGSESTQDDESGDFKERVKEKGKRRVCFGALPLWVIAVLVVLMVAVLAGVIGAVVGRARGRKQAESASPPLKAASPTPTAPATVVITTTFLPDAIPLPTTYSDLPALPTGTFYLPLRSPTVSNNTCLTAHVNAWDCSERADLKLDLSASNVVSVSPRLPPTFNQIYFGPQAPQLDQSVTMRLMGDRDGAEKGPAWYFQQNFTKIVVVPDNAFDMDEEYTRRWLDPQKGHWSSRRFQARGRGIARPPARPWFCYWNDTVLEGFIYVNQTSSGDTQPVVYSTEPTDSSVKRRAADPLQLSAYTKDVKIEERRNPHTDSEPYCVHMQIMNDGSAQALPDEKAVPLDEIETAYEQSVEHSTRLREKRGDFRARGLATSACECEWHIF